MKTRIMIMGILGMVVVTLLLLAVLDSSISISTNVPTQVMVRTKNPILIINRANFIAISILAIVTLMLLNVIMLGRADQAIAEETAMKNISAIGALYNSGKLPEYVEYNGEPGLKLIGISPKGEVSIIGRNMSARTIALTGDITQDQWIFGLSVRKDETSEEE